MKQHCQNLIHELQHAATEFEAARALGNRFVQLGSENGKPRLGWVEPPPWKHIERALDRAFCTRALRDKRQFIFCGTGGWIHSVRMVAEETGPSQNVVQTLYSLDPAALVSLLANNLALDKTALLGLSASGNTLETRLLIDTLQELLISAGLHVPDHLLWLSAKLARSLPLTVDGFETIGALFSAPFTLAFLLPVALLAGMQKTRRYFESFLALREQAVEEAVGQALDLDVSQKLLYLDTGGTSDPLDCWILQLARQSICGKSASFNPKILVGGESPDNFTRINLKIVADVDPIVAKMLTCHAAQFFFAAVAWRHDIAFVQHDNVNRYKRLINETPKSSLTNADLEAVQQKIDAVLRKNGRSFLEMVVYAPLTKQLRSTLRQSHGSLTGRHCEVYEGSDWNHHSYQAAAESGDTAYVFAGPWLSECEVPGIAPGTLSRNLGFLSAIAQATETSLSM